MRKELLRFIVVVLVAMQYLNLPTENFAQEKKLTYNQVYNFAPPRLFGSLPRLQGWLDDEHYLEVKAPDENSKPALMKVNAQTGESEIFLDYQYWNEMLPEGFKIEKSSARTEDRTGYLFNKKGELFYLNTDEESFKKFLANKSEVKNPKFSPNSEYVAFTRDNNLFAVNIETEEELQFTDDGSDIVYNGWASWVYYEEILGRSSRYAAFWWSPNSEMITFLRFDDTPVPKFPLYNADGSHGELEFEHYPKAGDPNPYVRLGIAHIKTGKVVWVDLEENADHYVVWPFWTHDSKELFFQWVNRGQDNIKIYAADPETGSKREVYDEKQTAWVEWFEDLYIMKNGSGFIVRSSVDGWYNLYYYDLTGNLKSKLTNSERSVKSISLVDEQNKKVYFIRQGENTTESHLFCVDLEGSNLKQITTTPGSHSCTVSPAGKYFYDRYSNISQPAKLDIYDTDGILIRKLGDQKSQVMDEYNLAKVELFTIPSGDGYDLPAKWYLPPDFDESKKYPVIFFVYGGPGSASVRNSYPYWLSSFYLAQNGIIVMTVDNRGSGHFGKKGMDLMHRNLGKWEMYDLIAAVEWLKHLPYIDTTKIAINGGSYGGYTTAMALTYGADYFTHGVAEYSVTDWQLYDNVYTERFMDTPEENPEGYKAGSVMTYADKYKGYMLITHGTLDDNVHMQNTIQLISKFEDLDKDFEVMLYPNARHGIGYPKRKHTSREKVQFWFRHLLNKELDIEKD